MAKTGHVLVSTRRSLKPNPPVTIPRLTRLVGPLFRTAQGLPSGVTCRPSTSTRLEILDGSSRIETGESVHSLAPLFEQDAFRAKVEGELEPERDASEDEAENSRGEDDGESVEKERREENVDELEQHRGCVLVSDDDRFEM